MTTDQRIAEHNQGICGYCHLPIHKSETCRHYGFFVAHEQARCTELLLALLSEREREIDRLEEEINCTEAALDAAAIDQLDDRDFNCLGHYADAVREAYNKDIRSLLDRKYRMVTAIGAAINLLPPGSAAHTYLSAALTPPTAERKED